MILGQYALDQGMDLSQKVGSKARQAAGELFITALDQLRQIPAGKVIAAEFEQDPATYQKPVEKELVQAIVGDPAFAARLKSLLAEYRQAVRENTAPTGEITRRRNGNISNG